jgi:hypothetical protein
MTRTSFRFAVTAMAAIAFLSAARANAAQTCQWLPVESGFTNRQAILYSEDVFDLTDVWTVGTNNAATHAVSYHFNGAKWIPYTTPSRISVAWSVSGVATNDLWLVGDFKTPKMYTARTAHWDGNAWTAVATPLLPTGGRLFGVKALTTADVWAAGVIEPSSSATQNPLVENWNGSAWTAAAAPPANMNGMLQAIDGSGPTDVWAVGSYTNALGQVTLADHYNGSGWSQVLTPNRKPGPGSQPYGNRLSAVFENSPSDVWAVGSYAKCSGSCGQQRIESLIEHFDGSTWTILPSPDVKGSDTVLTGVTATSATNAWASGYWGNASLGGALFEHWDGAHWHLLVQHITGQVLYDIGEGASSLWAVGDEANFTPFAETYQC